MKGILFIMIACLLWAIDTLIRYPLLFSGVSAELIVFCEHLLLAAIFFPILYKNREKFLKIKSSHLFYFFLIGGLGSAISTVTFTKAFGILNPSLVILLQKLQPIIAIFLSYYILKERMKKEFFGWAFIALIGGLCISYQDLSPAIGLIKNGEIEFHSNALKGYFLALTSVFGWAIATVYGKKLSKSGFDETEIMSGRFFMGLICLLPFLLSQSIELRFDFSFWWKICTIALVSGALGMFFYYKGLKRIPAHLCTLAEMFFPFFAVAINWIFLSKELTLLQITGGILLLVSSSMIQSKHL